MSLTLHVNASDNDRLFTTFNAGGTHTGTPSDGSTVQVWDDDAGITDYCLAYEVATNESPTWRQATPLMPQPCLDFDGTTQCLVTHTQTRSAFRLCSSFFTISAFTLIISFHAEALTVESGTRYSNHCLVGDSSGYWGVFLRGGVTPQVLCYNWDTAETGVDFNVTAGTNYVLMFRHESGTIFASLNGGTESSTASGNTADLDNPFCVGKTGQDVLLNGRIGEIKVWNTGNADGTLAAEVAAMVAKWVTGVTITTELSRYRWRNDDGSEATATPAAAENTGITSPIGTRKRLRRQITTVGDLSSSQMRLEWNRPAADSIWRPVGSVGLGATPAYTATGQTAAVTNATITTAILPTKPSTLNAGDLMLLQVLARNDNSNGAGPATISGWIAFPGNPYGGTNNARQSIYWRIAGAGEASQTVSVTCTGGTTADLAMARIYRLTAANGFAEVPIEGISSNAGTVSPMTAPASVTPTRGNRLAVCLGAIATSDTTLGSMVGETAGDWIERAIEASTIGGDGTLNVQTADATAGTAIQGGTIGFTVSTSSHWTTVGFLVVPVESPIILSDSPNITAGGANTTAQLTSPGGTFGGGRIQDDENPSDAVDLPTDGYGEWETAIEPTTIAANGHIYQLRDTLNGTVLTTYTQIPQLTIGAAVVPVSLVLPRPSFPRALLVR